MVTNPFTSVSVANYNLNPPSDDGAETARNEIKWATHKDKLADPLKTAIEAINTNALAAFLSVLMPSGIIAPYGGATAPTGWLLCDGSAVSRTTYADLFSAISTLYGVGNGSTTFNLPDLRGRLPVGKDNMGGSAASRVTTAGSSIDGATMGAAGGAENVALSTANLASHTHTGTTDNESAHTHFVAANGGSVVALSASNQLNNSYNAVNDFSYTLQGSATAASLGLTSGGSAHSHPFTTAAAGSGTAHNNMPPALVTNYIIKT